MYNLPQTLYFIPGTMCDEQLWSPAWKLLREQYSADYQLIHLVIPTAGSMEEVVNALSAQVIEKNAILVGFSLGGYIASAIALKLAHQLQHLVVVANFPKDLPLAEIKQRKRTIDWIKQRGYSGIPDKRIDDLLQPNIKHTDPFHYEQIKQVIVAMDQKLGADVLLHQLKVSMHRPSLVYSLTQLTLPVTFLVGDTDGLVELGSLREELKTALLPEPKQELTAQYNVLLKEIINTGHMLPLESPQALATTLIDVLTN